jgi:hypothetical protein
LICVTPHLQFHIVSAGTALEELDFVTNIKGFTKLDKIKSEDVLNQLHFFLFGATAHSGPGPPHSCGF